jgi:hypothetical protein
MQQEKKPYKILCRLCSEGDILRFPEGKTISNGKIIPVHTLLFKREQPLCSGYSFDNKTYTCDCHDGHDSFVLRKELSELDNDYYVWKDQKIKIRKKIDMREELKDKKPYLSPTNYDEIRYRFYYLEYD